jgi:hypothetical protein
MFMSFAAHTPSSAIYSVIAITMTMRASDMKSTMKAWMFVVCFAAASPV